MCHIRTISSRTRNVDCSYLLHVQLVCCDIFRIRTKDGKIITNMRFSTQIVHLSPLLIPEFKKISDEQTNGNQTDSGLNVIRKVCLTIKLI